MILEILADREFHALKLLDSELAENGGFPNARKFKKLRRHKGTLVDPLVFLINARLGRSPADTITSLLKEAV